MRRFLASELGPVPITEEMSPPEQDIVRAGNSGVQRALQEGKTPNKRTKQFKWSFTDRFRLGKIAAMPKGMGNALHEARKINPAANESTLRYFAKQYRDELKKNPGMGTQQKGNLVHKKRGKSVKIGSNDRVIINYIRQIRKHGGPINKHIVAGTATGILTREAPQKLKTATGKPTVTKAWVRSIYKRLRFKKRKGTKAAKKVPENAAELGDVFFNRIYDMKTKYNIPPSMIFVWDEHSSSFFPVTKWTMEEAGATQVAIVGKEDKRCITIGTGFSGPPFNMLKSQFIYEGKTNQCHPDIEWPETTDVTHSDTHWATENTVCRVIDNVFDPYLVEQRTALQLPDTQHGLVLWDVFRSHLTRRVLELLEARFIKACYTPANCTGLYAPPDHPEWHNNVKGLNTVKCNTWYAREVTRCLEENLPVEVNFTATVLKPLHAQWTLESLAFAATQKQWMENAWRGTGLLSILDGTFVPNPSLSSMYVPPPVATAEEAANCEPPSEEEYFYASSSEEGEVSEPEDAGQLELYEEGFSEEEQGLIDEDGCAET